MSPAYSRHCTAAEACKQEEAGSDSPQLLHAVQGFQKLRNVTGGIDAYSREVDSSVPLY